MKPQFKSWITTVFGGVAGVPTIMMGIESQDWQLVAAGVGMLLVGLFARDANKSSQDSGIR